MTKQELVQKMQNLGILETTGSRHELWVEAFRQYNKANSPKIKFSSCGSCFNTVRKWLKG